MPSVLRLFLAQAKHWLPAYTPIIDIILHCNLLQRKTILTLSRCQLVPSYPHTPESPMSYAYKQLGPSLESFVHIGDQSQTLHYLLSTIAILFSTPVSAGLINMLVRNLPLATADEEYPIEIKKGIEKEILAAISKYHPTSFNWDALSNYCSYHERKEKYPVCEATKALAQRFFLGSYVSVYDLVIFSNIPDVLMHSISNHASSPGVDYDDDPCSDDE